MYSRKNNFNLPYIFEEEDDKNSNDDKLKYEKGDIRNYSRRAFFYPSIKVDSPRSKSKVEKDKSKESSK